MNGAVAPGPSPVPQKIVHERGANGQDRGGRVVQVRRYETRQRRHLDADAAQAHEPEPGQAAGGCHDAAVSGRVAGRTVARPGSGSA